MQNNSFNFSLLNIPRSENKYAYKLRHGKFRWINIDRKCPTLVKHGFIGYSSDYRETRKGRVCYCALTPEGEQYVTYLDNKDFFPKIAAIAAILGALFGAITVIVAMSK